jgi:hypothetical protein
MGFAEIAVSAGSASVSIPVVKLSDALHWYDFDHGFLFTNHRQ